MSKEKNTLTHIFGERLRKLMELRGLTQVDVAEAAGVTQPTVQRWLKGSLPGSAELFTLCETLGERMEDFFGSPQRSSAIQRLRTKPEINDIKLVEKAINELSEAKQRLGAAEATLRKISSEKNVAEGAFEIFQKGVEVVKTQGGADQQPPPPTERPTAAAHQSSKLPPVPERPQKKN